jgi:CheY-like chemotaxis protein
LLPLTAAQNLVMPQVKPPLRGTGLILIVDDEAVMRATAGAILEDLGYQVLLAENGLAGLELFRQKSAEIDLVLLDMIMPEMNGRDCFMEIRKIDPTAKVVLSSGFTQNNDLADLRAAGLTGFIRKPYRGAGLSQTVAEALRSEGSASILWRG